MPFAVAKDSGIVIHSLRDVSEAMNACLLTDGLLITEAELGPGFFDLRSGLAGEFLQKFVNYKVRVGIVVSDPAAYGERMEELIREHRSHPVIRFFGAEPDARAWLEAGGGSVWKKSEGTAG